MHQRLYTTTVRSPLADVVHMVLRVQLRPRQYIGARVRPVLCHMQSHDTRCTPRLCVACVRLNVCSGWRAGKRHAHREHS
jgi:hypothetical protein